MIYAKNSSENIVNLLIIGSDIQYHLRIPDQKWKFADFEKYIVDNSKYVFEGSRRRWLKMYLVYINDSAKKELKKLEPRRQGDLEKFQMKYKEPRTHSQRENTYYMSEIEPGLACFYTSSTKEDYEKTMSKTIQRTRGMSEMWMKPEIFDKVKDFVVDEYNATIKGFVSLSSFDEEERARVRPNIDRKINYRGDDGLDAIKELRTWYGVLPISIDFKIKGNVFQITNEGLFTFKTPNEQSFEIVRNILELIRSEQTEQKEVASTLRFETDGNGPNIEAGQIILPSNELISDSGKALMTHFSEDFTFTDICFSDESVDFSATVIDKHKGSVFDLSTSDKDMILIPRYEATYESFLNFYRHVVEVFDRRAKLQVLSY